MTILYAVDQNKEKTMNREQLTVLALNTDITEIIILCHLIICSSGQC